MERGNAKPEDEKDFLKTSIKFTEKILDNNSYCDGLERLATDFNRQTLAKQMLDLIKPLKT